jgi:hypothetical protein
VRHWQEEEEEEFDHEMDDETADSELAPFSFDDKVNLLPTRSNSAMDKRLGMSRARAHACGMRVCWCERVVIVEMLTGTLCTAFGSLEKSREVRPSEVMSDCAGFIPSPGRP